MLNPLLSAYLVKNWVVRFRRMYAGLSLLREIFFDYYFLFVRTTQDFVRTIIGGLQRLSKLHHAG